MAASLSLSMDRLASYTLELSIKNADSSAFDLTGYTGVFKIAKRSDKTKVLEIIGVETDNKVEIVGAANLGKIKIFIKSVTLPLITSDSLFTKEPSDYFYTLSITKDNVSTRLMDGLIALADGIA